MASEMNEEQMIDSIHDFFECRLKNPKRTIYHFISQLEKGDSKFFADTKDFEYKFFLHLRSTDENYLEWRYTHVNDYAFMLDSEMVGGSLLHVAGCFNFVKLAEWLLIQGMSPDITNYKHQTPLFLMCESRSERFEPMIKLLLKFKANPNIADEFEYTPLHETPFPSIIEMLIEAGADLSLIVYSGFTPLRLACFANQEEKVDLLLKHGAPLHNCPEGNNELFYSCQEWNPSRNIVKKLIDANLGHLIPKKD